jgi:hypothetical protein
MLVWIAVAELLPTATSAPWVTPHELLCEGDENNFNPQLIPVAPDMVASTAEVNAGQRSVQFDVPEQVDAPVVFLQLLEQQQSSAMLSLIDPDLSKTSSTSVGNLVVLEVCSPQFASAVGGEPPPVSGAPPPILVVPLPPAPGL